jgi:FkbM family methyltransferase
MHTLKTVHGWAFPAADEFMSQELQPDGTYQASHLHAALQYVTDWTCAADMGAHAGTWSRILSGRFDKVIAAEPSADTFAALEVNMQTFGCTNVELRPVAVGAAAGRVDMVLDGRGATLKNTGSRHVGPGDSVVVEAIDAWQLPTLGFLKLDIEGSEVFALMGARATLLRCRPIVLFENKYLWKQYKLPRDAPQQFLKRLHYRHLVNAGCDEIWGPA